MVDELIPIGLFGAPIIITYLYLTYRTRKLKVLAKLIDDHPDVPRDLMEAVLGQPESRALHDKRMAVFCLVVGGAMMIALFFGAFGNSPRLSLVGLLPISIGISYLIVSKLDLDKH